MYMCMNFSQNSRLLNLFIFQQKSVLFKAYVLWEKLPITFTQQYLNLYTEFEYTFCQKKNHEMVHLFVVLYYNVWQGHYKIFQ